MDSTGTSVADILALTKGNNDGFLGGNAGGILALIIVFILLFGRGNNAPSFIPMPTPSASSTDLALSDINMAQYFQTQDTAIRSIAQGQSTVTEQVMNSNYENSLLLKDLSNQLSNSVAGISNQISNQTNTIQNMFNANTIRELSDKLAVERDKNNNNQQTMYLDNAVQRATDTILNSQGRYVMNPPCYTGCSCGNSLY